MAMSVAEQPVTESPVQSPHRQLALRSLLGAIYLLFALWVIFAGLPMFWHEVIGIPNDFLAGALLLIATQVVGLGLWWVGYSLERSHSQPGLRAGVFFAALFIYLIAWF